MKLIVTGGLGHIGSALIRRTDLIPAGSEIVIVDDLSTQRFPSLFDLPDSLKYTLREGDVADALVPSDLHRADAVIHLAAKTDPTESVRNPESFFANNLRLTKHVASLCTQHGVPLVFASSTSVYTPTDGRITESTPTENPHSPYAQCKVAEEEVLASAFREGLVGTSFRLGTIYGPSPGMRFHTAVNRFCWEASLNAPLRVWTTALDQKRPYLSVRDATGALIRSVTTTTYVGGPLNAASCDATVRRVIAAIRSTGLAPSIALQESPLMTDDSWETSTEAARKLGFHFNDDLEEQVAETLRVLHAIAQRPASAPASNLTSR